MQGFIIYPTYRILNSKPYVCLFGRLQNDESFLTINEFHPYFYIKEADLKKIKLKELKTEKTNLANFKGEKVVKLICGLPSDVPKIRRKLERHKIECYEADIRFAYRFMFDHNIYSSISIEGEYTQEEKIGRVYKNPEVNPTEYKPKLKVLALDIETDSKEGKIYCISTYTSDFKKVLIVSNKKLKNAVNCKTEEELLENFHKLIQDLDPDIITGWNVIDFDLRIIMERCKKYHLPFNLGRDNTPTKISMRRNFFQRSKADAVGRVVLDALNLLQTSFIKLKDFKLSTAAKEFLQDEKLIDFKDKGAEIDELYKNSQQRLVDYNLKDSELVYKILEKNILDLTIQRSLITGLPLDRVNASIASFDSLYIKEARKRNLVVPSSKFEEKEAKITGGYVMESKPGIYDNIIILDFKSLYPSIIRTFNIDPYAFNQKDGVKTPSGAKFAKEESILPQIIQKLWEGREKARLEKNELTRQAIKILMNSLFGVLASPSCRFFNLELANSITKTGQFIIKLITKETEKLGYEVIYGDTDAIFVKTNARSIEEAEQIGKKLEHELNIFHKKYIQNEFKRNSYLELEFKAFFVRFLMPKIRYKEKGAKKRYAGLTKEGKMEVTGLEFIRSDWTELAKEFQFNLLDLIFNKKEVSSYIKNIVENLKAGKLDDKLIYKKSIRKELSEYIKTTPPHIKAARKLIGLGTTKIEYIITVDGPEPIQNIKHKIDYGHYINKQLKPIADAILVFFNKTFDELLQGSKQTTLFSYK